MNKHFAKFNGPRHLRNGDIMAFVCHAISEEHVIKASYDFMGRGFSR